MDRLTDTPPRTIMELYKNLPEGTLAELVDNMIYMSPSPVYKHQKLLQNLFRRLSKRITDNDLGEVIVAPFDVYLDEESNAVQPDITVVLTDRKSILDESGHIHGVPNLIVEVLSPGNKDHDLIRKKELYERFGVEEYWIVDPDTNLALVYSLEDLAYTKTHEEIGTIQSILLDVRLAF